MEGRVEHEQVLGVRNMTEDLSTRGKMEIGNLGSLEDGATAQPLECTRDLKDERLSQLQGKELMLVLLFTNYIEQNELSLCI